jgi:NTE family protein
VRLGEMVLVDGGLTNNLPSDLARAMGADVVLGVSVLSVFDEKRRYDTFFDIALGTMDLMSKVSTEAGALGCDICLSPLVGPRSPSDLARAPSMVAEGEAAMLRALPKLKELLGQ